MLDLQPGPGVRLQKSFSVIFVRERRVAHGTSPSLKSAGNNPRDLERACRDDLADKIGRRNTSPAIKSPVRAHPNHQTEKDVVQ